MEDSSLDRDKNSLLPIDDADQQPMGLELNGTTASLDRSKFLALAGGFGVAGVLSATLGPKLWE